MTTKQKLLDAAEVADAWRLIPRGIMAGYAFLVYDAQVWYFALPDPSVAQSGYQSVLWGGAIAVTNFYFSSGRKWNT